MMRCDAQGRALALAPPPVAGGEEDLGTSILDHLAQLQRQPEVSAQ
jgi:hypothetical protein